MIRLSNPYEGLAGMGVILSLNFILIQLEEPLDKKSPTYKMLEENGYEPVLSNAGMLRLDKVLKSTGGSGYKVLR